VSQRKPFLLRIDPQVLEALQKWADQDLRSLNGQIEFVLRQVLIERGRMKDPEAKRSGPPDMKDRQSRSDK
jgi:hypothetical protein